MKRQKTTNSNRTITGPLAVIQRLTSKLPQVATIALLAGAGLAAPATADDIQSTWVGSELTLTGDVDDNQVLIEPGVDGNSIVVTGLGTTTVDGVVGPATFTGIEKLEIRLVAGENVLTADGLSMSLEGNSKFS